ncbi:MAG TPA: hypothetical protein VLF20_02430 [Patescibacteria group bacterium]|nr:hypothetical protein [Patescibacteria group bacterium]
MLTTLYRYKIFRANWEKMSQDKVKQIVSEINNLKFDGEIVERQYGFTYCDSYNDNILFGIFIQKFPTTLKDYDPETKKEIKKEDIDSGAYYFIINLNKHEMFLQAKRDANLPGKDLIALKFQDLLKIALSKSGFTFHELVEAHDEINRNEIIKIFYETADEVYELDLQDFDSKLIEEEKLKRGGQRQTYFNPKEEYQEAMEEGAIKSAKTVRTASLKAKKGESLKKNPIARALLEGSRNPKRILYRQNDSIRTTSAVINRKVEILIEDDKPLSEQIPAILEKLEPMRIRSITKQKNQEELF